MALRLVHAGAVTAARLSATAAPPAAVAGRRGFASPPAQLDAAAVAAPPAAEPAPAAAASTSSSASASGVAASGAHPAKKASSLWGRLTAFLTGVGVSSVYFFYTLSDDLAKSNAAVDASLAAFKRDATSSNAELRQRIATLEHEVAALKQRQ